jgi:hypothetical protein
VERKFQKSRSREKQEKIEENSRELICKITPNTQEILQTPKMTPGGSTVCFCYEQEVRMKTNMLATSS